MARAARSTPSPTSADELDRNAWRDAVWGASRQELPPMSRLVALALASFMDRSGRAWPSYEAIAERCGMPRSTMARHLDALKAGGWVRVEPHGGPRSGRREHPNLYSVATPSHLRDEVQPAHRPADGTESPPTPSRSAATPSRSAADTVPPVGRELPEPHEPPLSPEAEEPAVYVESAERPPEETTTATSSEDYGPRTLAALAARGCHRWGVRELEQAHRRAEDRLGIGLAADAVMAVALLPGTRSLAGFITGTDVTEVRRLAEEHREERERPPRPPRAPSRYACEHGHANGLRRSSDGASPCAACDGAGPVPAPPSARRVPVAS